MHSGTRANRRYPSRSELAARQSLRRGCDTTRPRDHAVYVVCDGRLLCELVQFLVYSCSNALIAESWTCRGIYDRKYNVVDLEKKAEKLSHVLYAFANVQDDGEVVLGVLV